jgi:hypothetical protein
VNFERDELLLHCIPDYGCEFTVYFRDLKLGALGSLPYDALPQWREVKEGIRTLLERWIVKR